MAENSRIIIPKVYCFFQSGCSNSKFFNFPFFLHLYDFIESISILKDDSVVLFLDFYSQYRFFCQLSLIHTTSFTYCNREIEGNEKHKQINTIFKKFSCIKALLIIFFPLVKSVHATWLIEHGAILHILG